MSLNLYYTEKIEEIIKILEQAKRVLKLETDSIPLSSVEMAIDLLDEILRTSER